MATKRLPGPKGAREANKEAVRTLPGPHGFREANSKLNLTEEVKEDTSE